MSLHRKIIGWFGIFAALTVIVFVVGDHLLSTRALRFGLETRAGALALQVSGEVERRYHRAETELLALGYAAAAGAVHAFPEPETGFRDVRVLRDGAEVFRAGSWGVGQEAAAGCAEGDVQFSSTLRDAAGATWVVEGHLPAAHFFAGVTSTSARLGQRGLTAVLRSGDGTLAYDAACRLRDNAEALAALTAFVVERAESPAGAVVLNGEQSGDELVFASVRSAAPAWTVVASLDYGEFAAPFVTMRKQYFGTMGGVMLLGLVLVLAGIWRDMRRLEAISAAADAIGHGHFDVWLPPPTGDEIGRVSLALGRMTERLSSTLRQVEVSRSMAAVGELATYLSHEIRNPLSSIRLNLQMLRRDLRAGAVPDDGEKLVGLCLSEIQRLDAVVRTVLDMGRVAPQAKGSCAAHPVVEETLRVMEQKLAARSIAVDMRLDAADSRIAMPSASLRSIIMNLVLNSADALAETADPRITIRSRLVDVMGTEQRFELRVADNGPGVPPHLRERIFDPFFTTKAAGNGVGLPTAMRAVQECGGILRHEPASEWGGGAEFVLELPLATPASEDEMLTLPMRQRALARQSRAVASL